MAADGGSDCTAGAHPHGLRHAQAHGRTPARHSGRRTQPGLTASVQPLTGAWPPGTALLMQLAANASERTRRGVSTQRLGAGRSPSISLWVKVQVWVVWLPARSERARVAV